MMALTLKQLSLVIFLIICHLVDGAIKSIVFGFACTIIALFEGFDAPPTAEGVSRATTRTVVISSLAVLGLDFILTSFMFV